MKGNDAVGGTGKGARFDIDQRYCQGTALASALRGGDNVGAAAGLRDRKEQSVGTAESLAVQRGERRRKGQDGQPQFLFDQILGKGGRVVRAAPCAGNYHPGRMGREAIRQCADLFAIGVELPAQSGTRRTGFNGHPRLRSRIGKPRQAYDARSSATKS
ncbi:MAG: hypothetical protein R3E03_09100 [Novosphingobium sp.]